VRIHALYTPSHSRLAEEHFLPSASRFFGEGNVDCQLVGGAPEGSYGTPGFVSYCQGRLQRYVEICESADGPLVLSDVDVRFYGDVPADLEEVARVGESDAYFQWDGPGDHCMGFVFARRPRHFARVLRQIDEVVRAHPELDDQRALRYLVLRDAVQGSLGVLPTSKYWTSGLQGHVWLPGESLSPPAETLLMHHGNWTFGVPNKLDLLAAVAGLVAARGRVVPTPGDGGGKP
jgi:hypothetical protein